MKTSLQPSPKEIKSLQAVVSEILKTLSLPMKRAGFPISPSLISLLAGNWLLLWNNDMDTAKTKFDILWACSGDCYVSWMPVNTENLRMLKEDLLEWKSRITPKSPMDKVSEEAREKIEKKYRETSHFRVSLDVVLTRSRAFKNLDFAPAFKVLLWAYEEQKFEKSPRRRGREKWIRIQKEFALTYDEALYRGLSNQQCAHALKMLHGLGFIDFVSHGRGLQKDFSIFLLSDRWKKFGNDDFEAIPFPQSNSYGYRGASK